MVLFNLPSCVTRDGIEMGLIVSVWRGLRSPHLFSGGSRVESCPAFRAVLLDMEEDDKSLSLHKRWYCSATSPALVVRMESLVTILDVETCLMVAKQMFKQGGGSRVFFFIVCVCIVLLFLNSLSICDSP